MPGPQGAFSRSAFIRSGSIIVGARSNGCATRQRLTEPSPLRLEAFKSGSQFARGAICSFGNLCSQVVLKRGCPLFIQRKPTHQLSRPQTHNHTGHLVRDTVAYWQSSTKAVRTRHRSPCAGPCAGFSKLAACLRRGGPSTLPSSSYVQTPPHHRPSGASIIAEQLSSGFQPVLMCASTCPALNG